MTQPPMDGNTQEPESSPRLLDVLLECYVKIGGYIGVGLSAVAFIGTFVVSYWFFRASVIEHFHSVALDIVILIATFFTAASVAVFVFFTSSVFWLPMIIGMFFLGLLIQDALQRIHHLHH